MAAKNNVTRFLDSRDIRYEAVELPAEKLGAGETARFLGVEAQLVYKTIVVKHKTDGKPILALVPGDSQVDLKKLAREIGEKKLVLPTQKEAENITGLQAGGISPLALLNKGFQVVIDISANNHAVIYVSGGMRGLNIRLSPVDLGKITHAKFLRIC